MGHRAVVLSILSVSRRLPENGVDLMGGRALAAGAWPMSPLGRGYGPDEVAAGHPAERVGQGGGVISEPTEVPGDVALREPIKVVATNPPDQRPDILPTAVALPAHRRVDAPGMGLEVGHEAGSVRH